MKEKGTNRKSSRRTSKVDRLVIQSQSSQSNKKTNQSGPKEVDDGHYVVKCFPASPGAKCAICRTDRVDEMLLGDFLSCFDPEDANKGENDDQVNVTSVHYACLLTACNLYQIHDDDELELRGFSVASVKKEVRRCASEVCVYCKKKGAVVGCCLKRCKRMFHFPCALENGVITEFYDVYNSWCDHHAQPQIIPEQPKDACCPICADEFEDRPLFNCECCSNVLHKDCLRPYVFNAGTYFLKCPFCQDVDKFKNLIDRFCGIHIPTREPTYEDHDRMVVELVCAYEFCPDPDKCVDDEDWRLIKCIICGGRAMHVMCVAKAFVHQRFVCPDCGDNDSYESSYRVLARMGSGSEVGRMFPWQFLSLTQLVHSVKIPQCDENGVAIKKSSSKLGSDTDSHCDTSSVKSSTRRKMHLSSKRKAKSTKEAECIEICYEKRGTKEILGEIDFSSDEEPTPEDDQQMQVEESSEKTEVKTSRIDEEMRSLENVNVQLTKGTRGKKRTNNKQTNTKKKVETKKGRPATNENHPGGRSPTSGNATEEVTKDIVHDKKEPVPKVTPGVIENPLNETKVENISSKENEKPDDTRSNNRLRKRGATPSKKPKYEEPIYISSDSSDSVEELDQPLEVLGSRYDRVRKRTSSLPSHPSPKSELKQSCNHRVDLFSPNSKATVNSAVTFKRPVRDSVNMRKVVIGGTSLSNSASFSGTAIGVPINGGGDADIENNSAGVSGGAHHFHFRSRNASKTPGSLIYIDDISPTSISSINSILSKSNMSSNLSSSISVPPHLCVSPRPNSIPLSVNTHHVIHNLKSPLTVDANQRVTRASVGGSNLFDTEPALHSF